jgi:hypothetical protein
MPEKDPKRPKPSKKSDKVSVPRPEPMPKLDWDEAGLPGDPTTDGPPPRPKKEDEP